MNQPDPDWNDVDAVYAYLEELLVSHPMELYEDKASFYSPASWEARFDGDLANAARAEGLSDAAIAALLVACHSDDEHVALDAYRDMISGRWKVCPSVIPPWYEREDPNADVRLWLPEWFAKWQAGEPF
jgi:hypothetical protein